MYGRILQTSVIYRVVHRMSFLGERGSFPVKWNGLILGVGNLLIELMCVPNTLGNGLTLPSLQRDCEKDSVL